MVYCRGRDPVEVYLKIFHPKIRKRKHSSMSGGYGWVYYDGDTNQKLFKYITGGPVVKTERGFENLFPIRLCVNSILHNNLNSTIPNVKDHISKWFDRKYDLEYGQLVSFIH